MLLTFPRSISRARIDADHNGKITKKEFRKGLEGIPQVKMSAQVMEELFMFIDSDRSGFIEPRELSRLRHRLASVRTQPKEGSSDDGGSSGDGGGGGSGHVRALVAIDDEGDEFGIADRKRQPGGPADCSWQDLYIARPEWRDHDLQTARDISPLGSPRSPRQQRFEAVGWVTIAKEGRRFVTLAAHLDASSRQQHLQAWQRKVRADKTIDRAKAAKAEDSHQVGGMGASTGAQFGSPMYAKQMGATSAKMRSEIKQQERTQARRRYANELESDPTGTGFAYGGVYPGKLHAKGKLFEAHKVSYSIGRVGTYELHVGLRQHSMPLPGSPFTLQVVAGVASALTTSFPPGMRVPLLGTAGFKEDHGCSVTLRVCDKMGNKCRVGGAKVTCSCVDTGVRCETRDEGDGTYVLTWRSELSGTFGASVEIEGDRIMGSPVSIQVVSDNPDLARTVAYGDGIREACAGLPAIIRLQLLDQFGNLALGGTHLAFGMIMTSAEKGTKGAEKNKWRRTDVPSDAFDGSWERDEYTISFVPEKAGVFDLHIWAVTSTVIEYSKPPPKKKKTKDDEFTRRMLSSGLAGGRPKDKVEDDDAVEEAPAAMVQEGSREALPGSPFRVVVQPSQADATGSFINGLYKSIVENSFKGGSVGSDAKSKGDAANAVGVNALLPPGTTVGAGDTIFVKPSIRDRYGNLVSAPEGSLMMWVDAPAGTTQRRHDLGHRRSYNAAEIEQMAPAAAALRGAEEPSHEDDLEAGKLPAGEPETSKKNAIVVAEQRRGDQTLYEGKFTPKVLGEYALHIALDGTPITGSPLKLSASPGVPDVRTSRFLLPEPPFAANVDYNVQLITVDKYNNECNMGGATVLGRIVSQNLPPGQETTCAVEDMGNGLYNIRLHIKASAEVKLVVSIAREGLKLSKLEARAENMLEFPPLPFRIENAKLKEKMATPAPTRRASPEARTVEGESVNGQGDAGEHQAESFARRKGAGSTSVKGGSSFRGKKSTKGRGSSDVPEVLKRAGEAYSSLKPPPPPPPAAAPPAAAPPAAAPPRSGAPPSRRPALEIFKRAGESVIEGFGSREERRARKLAASPQEAVALAVAAFSDGAVRKSTDR